MRPLSKLLKPKFLSSYLRDALDDLIRPHGFSPQDYDYFLALADSDGQPVFCAGSFPPPDTLFRTDANDTTPGSPHRLGMMSDKTVPALRHALTSASGVSFQLFAGLAGKDADTQLMDIFRQREEKLRMRLSFLGRTFMEFLDRENRSRAVGEEALEQYRELSLLQRAVINLNQSRKIHDVARALLKECRLVFPAECGMVFFREEQSGRFAPLDIPEEPAIPGLDQVVNSDLFRQVIEEDRGEIVNDLARDHRWNNEVPKLAGVLIIPLRAPGITLGALVLGTLSRQSSFTAGHLKKSGTLASVSGIATANAFHFEQVQHILVALINAMATAIDSRDSLTAGHSSRVAQYSLALAKAVNKDSRFCPDLSFSGQELQELFYAGLLHDVGKIGVREEVLTKASRLPAAHLDLIRLRLAMWGDFKGEDWKDVYDQIRRINTAYDLTPQDRKLLNVLSRSSFEACGIRFTVLTEEERERFLTPRGNLTVEEWNEIQRHPVESHRILKNIPFTTFFPNILEIVLQHHERLDGSGYPRGLTARELIPQSRILAIVDIYDSLTRDRHYKKALSREDALKILLMEADDGRIDSQLVNLLVDNLEHIEADLDHSLGSDSIKTILG